MNYENGVIDGLMEKRDNVNKETKKERKNNKSKKRKNLV